MRWAAMRGASIVFHPHICLGETEDPYYGKAQICRSVENTIYFASVNYALERQESATCLPSPAGERLASAPYGEETLLVQEIEPSKATGLLARRYSPDRYGDAWQRYRRWEKAVFSHRFHGFRGFGYNH